MRGHLAPHAASVLMKLLYGARIARFDLLRQFDGCRYGLKQRYAKKPMPIFDLGGSLSRSAMETMSMDLVPVVKPKKPVVSRR